MKTLWRSRNVLMLSTLIALLRAQSLSAASLSVSGSSQYVSVPQDANLTPSQFTLEAWVKVPGTGLQTIISRGNGNDGLTDYIFQLSNAGAASGNQVSLYAGSAWHGTTTIVQPNTWTHVAVTYDGKNKLFYINGALDKSAPWTNTIQKTDSSPMYIGRQGSVCNCNFFNGNIAEVRVWNTIRTADQIMADMNFSSWGKQPGLVAYYHLNEGGGSTANDMSGNGHTGTLQNSASWAGTTPPSLGTITALEGSGAGMDSVSLADPGTAWTAKTNAPWLHLSAANQSGTGNTNVIFSFDANPGLTRTGALTIAGINLTVTQAGTNYVDSSGVATLYSDLIAPTGVAVDGVGNVYYADYALSTVSMWSQTNYTVTNIFFIGTNKITVVTNLSFSVTNLLVYPNVYDPYDVAMDGVGNLYIPDTGNNALKKWTASTHNLTTLATGLSLPSGVGLDNVGNVYVADTVNSIIGKWSIVSQTYSPLITSGIFYPGDVAADNSGTLYPGNSSVYKWSPANPTLVPVGYFNNPKSIALDGGGNIYASSSDNTVLKWSPTNGAISVLLSNQVSRPWGLAVDGAGNMFIGDTSGAIRELYHAFVDPTPRFEPLAGGSDALPKVLPATLNLVFPFAPSSNDLPWLTINSASNGVVNFTCAPSTTNRTGSITLLGQTIPVLQFDALLSTNVIFLGPAAGNTNIVLTLNPNITQTWTASSPASWLHGTNGSGSGVVNFTFDANHAAARFGVLTVAGQTITIIQSMGSADIPSVLIQPTIQGDGSFQFNFTNIPGASFTTLFSTDPSLPLNLWTPIGNPIENSPGEYQFNDPAPPNPQGFYNIRSP